MNTKNREPIFGTIVDGNLKLFQPGKIVELCWKELPERFKNVILDEYMIMPDHFHGIIILIEDVSSRGLINQTPTDDQKWILMKNPKPVLGKMIRHFKAKSAKMIHNNGYEKFQWQRNYYEHIIRGEKDLINIQKYIYENPYRWTMEHEVNES